MAAPVGQNRKMFRGFGLRGFARWPEFAGLHQVLALDVRQLLAGEGVARHRPPLKGRWMSCPGGALGSEAAFGTAFLR